MSEFFPCWILKPDLFFSFFKKYPAARKLLAAALTGFPPKRLVSVLWYPGSLYEGGFCLQVRPDNRASFILELVPVFSGQLPFAVSESPPENASFTVPRGNFLQVFLTFQEANQQNLFSMEISTPPLCPFPAVSSIFLPSSPLFLPFRISMPFPVSFWSAIPPNCLPSPGVFPPSLLSRRSWKKFSGNRSYEPYLQKHLIFPRKLPAESRHVFRNRLLLREKRFDELQKVSDDPEALRNLFREFRAKGFFAYKKDPCRLHRSQEKREKYI